MEKKTIGKFITALRKANGMTQKELGEKLFISDKTISRWECDECTPELSLLPSIAEIFHVTTDELLRGERNNPERNPSTKVSEQQKAKTNKQFMLMLHEAKKKYFYLSMISIGVAVLGLITATILDLGFTRGILGFCFASVFFLASIVCQACFTASSRLLVDEEENEERIEETKKCNSNMVFTTIKLFFGILSSWIFCLPIAIFVPNGYTGLSFSSWIIYGGLFALIAFLLLFCIYRLFVWKKLIDRHVVWANDRTIATMNAKRKILKKTSLVFASCFAVITLAIVCTASFVTIFTFVKIERFDDPDEFRAYMKIDYDKWYHETYPEAPYPSGNNDPFKHYDYVEGNQFYYQPELYYSITKDRLDDGTWDLTVITKESYYNGMEIYDSLMNGLITLHAVNFVTCSVWYLVETKKTKIS